MPEAPLPEAPAWADAQTAIMLDLPAPLAIAHAAWIALQAGHEPVATFNNWPHDRGDVDMWPALGALLHYVPWVVQARSRRRVDSYRHGASAPPVFMLDAARLGRPEVPPGRFDNRYFLLDSDLPTEAALRRGGIGRVVYVHAPRPHESDDLNRYLYDLAKRLPLAVAHALPSSWTVSDAEPFSPVIRTTPFNTTSDPTFQGFRRNAAGGFGKIVPEPSSGGGGG